MKQYKKYMILATDLFEERNFSAVAEEVDKIREQSKNLPQEFKADIIISFAKNHSLEDDWLTANTTLTDLVSSGTLLTGSIEALFDSCKDNQAFSKGFEAYLRKNLS